MTYESRIISDEGDKNYRSLCDMEAECGVIDLNMFLWRKSSVSILIHIQLWGTKVGWFRPDGCWVTIGVVCFAWTYIGSMYILQGCSIATYCHMAMAMESSSRSQDLTNREYLLNFLELPGGFIAQNPGFSADEAIAIQNLPRRCGKVHAASLGKCSEEFLKRHVTGIWQGRKRRKCDCRRGILYETCKITWWTTRKVNVVPFFREDVHGCSVDFFGLQKSCT